MSSAPLLSGEVGEGTSNDVGIAIVHGSLSRVPHDRLEMLHVQYQSSDDLTGQHFLQALVATEAAQRGRSVPRQAGQE